MSNEIWLVIPALNEAKTLRGILTSAKEIGMRSLVVDDGSTDLTREIALEHSDLIVFHDVTKGYSASIRDGFQALMEREKIGWLVTFDADGQLLTNEVASLVNGAICNGASIAIGVRNNLPRISERVAAAIFYRLIGVQDPLCGMKAFRVDMARPYLESAGKSLNMELAARIILSGGRLFSMPITSFPRLNGKSRFGSISGGLRIFLVTGLLVIKVLFFKKLKR